MNILIFNAKNKWGGVVAWTEKIIFELKKRNHLVVVVAKKKSKFSEMSKFKKEIIKIRVGGDFNPFSIFKLIYLIKKHNIDIIISNTDKEVSIAGVAAKICGIANIRRVGSHNDLSQNRRYFKIMEKYLITHNIMSAKYIFSETYKTNKKIKLNDYSVIYHGKDKINYSPQEIDETKKSWGINHDEIVIGITCQLVKIKGISDLINVFNQLLKVHPKLKLVITGEGNLKHELLDMTDKLDLKDKIIFTGFTNHPKLHDSAYDICVHTSYSESIPNSIFEYLTVGKPIVTSNAGGTKEVMQNQYNCLIYEPGDLKTLYNHLDKVLTDKETAQYISRNALKTADEYSTDMMITKLENLLSRFIR